MIGDAPRMLKRTSHLTRPETVLALAGMLLLSPRIALGQPEEEATPPPADEPEAKGARAPAGPPAAELPPTGATTDSAQTDAAAARAIREREAAEQDKGEAMPPDPREGETLPRPKDPSDGAASEGERPGGSPPASYLLPPPPAGVYYPGPVPTPGGQTDSGELKLPSRISTRLRVLAADLDALANRGGPSLTNGVLSVVTGGLSIALGALLAEESLSPFLYVFGGASMARGVVDLVFSPDPDAVALEFSHMPMRDVDEVKMRLRFGERGLRGLADDARIARILDGSLSVAAGVAVVPLVLLPLSEEEDRELEALDVFVVIGAGISVLSGVVSLVSKSDAERRDQAYTKLKRRLSRPPGATKDAAKDKEDVPDPKVSMSVSPFGASLRLVQRF